MKNLTPEQIADFAAYEAIAALEIAALETDYAVGTPNPTDLAANDAAYQAEDNLFYEEHFFTA